MTQLNPDEIKKMEAAGKLAARTLIHVEKYLKAGMSTMDIDKIVHDYALSNGATPATLGYRGWPSSVCTSVNDCICHGLPNKSTILKDGDRINIDVTVIKDRFHGDHSKTFFIGNVSEKVKDITSVAYEAMMKGIEEVKPFATTGDIGFAVNKYVTKKGYHVVREIGGHGINTVFHDDPWIPSYGKKGRGEKLKPWICITVEPMILETDVELREVDVPGTDIKEYYTGDGRQTAQFEHTVLVTDTGYRILTLDN